MNYRILMPMGVTHRSITRTAIGLGQPEFRVPAFQALAFRMLEFFAVHEALQELKATAVYLTSGHTSEQAVEVSHHLKLTPLGADIGLSTANAQEEFAHEVAPTPFLGEGCLTLTRTDPVVTQFLTALAADDSEQTELEVYRLALRLVRTLGRLTVVHRLNSLM